MRIKVNQSKQTAQLPPFPQSSQTPLMKQYWEIKSAHGDKILFFRMGDFYEMFFDDAVVAAPVIGIALTSRNKKSQDETPMCGIPHHSIAGPINRLLAQGYKVALCDQIEDPKFAKGIVKRAVTRILTPGMVFDNETLDASESHYMACLEANTLSFVEPTTGEAFYFETQNNDKRLFLELLQLLPVAELILTPGEAENLNKEKIPVAISIYQENPRMDFPDKGVQGHPDMNGYLSQKELPPSARRLLCYIKSLGGEEALKVIKDFEVRQWQKRLDVSATTLRHMEIFQTYKGESKGSLLRSIQRTQTSPGARLLRQWLAFPLRDVNIINERLELVEKWRNDLGLLKRVREVLAKIGDIERRLTRMSTPQCYARDMISLAQSTLHSVTVLDLAHNFLVANPQDKKFWELRTTAELMIKTFREDAPLSTRQGHMIHQGISKDLDEMIFLTQDTQTLLAQMEAKEKETTGISSLKIRYNNVFGYYIEITNTHKDKAPTHYQRKQTLANAERFCTEELLELEKKILTAQSKRADLEWSIFDMERKKIIADSHLYLGLAQKIAEIDVITSLAWLSVEQNYCRPHFNKDGAIDIKASRHPVIEQEMKLPFIANNIRLATHSCMLLTGPNMAGKSTLMRQVAVTAIMGQMGSFVAAEYASLPVFDQIFTRIGASDQLTEGLSTFMVEMKETAEIINRATDQSLVIMDEVGRGTSTFDGLSLAQAILEHMLVKIKSIMFFATHFHELTELENYFPHLLNYHMSVSEYGGDVSFLHSLVKGPALKSYGIYVADLAGVPSSVTRRAKALLKKVEEEKMQISPQKTLFEFQEEQEAKQLCDFIGTDKLDAIKESGPDVKAIDENMAALIRDLQDLNVMNITPMEALTKIAKWQENLVKWTEH
jgi:DNA mismatch repair protein MutS